MGNIIKRCPVCDGKIVVSYLCQYSLNYTVTSKGTLSQKFKKHDDGPIDVAIAACSGCGNTWEDDEFSINAEGYFVDYKYE